MGNLEARRACAVPRSKARVASGTGTVPRSKPPYLHQMRCVLQTQVDQAVQPSTSTRYKLRCTLPSPTGEGAPKGRMRVRAQRRDAAKADQSPITACPGAFRDANDPGANP
ncbi:hypothetical protein CAI18_19600 [Xanthomonas citri pv. punicae]|nr:hypothetical protein CAI14_01565 [Xanthomonas citri pv. punicae]QCZ70872.1 hypothetical protein CAI17_22130 [Xanthomonas citri pv. punicae]QCZ72085.1 hypothetical protein CAB38_03780 [Xanthomonas citri pv. punicae]QCZ78327.1 hypothetical protein XapA_17620 [Xanthomonas citri pv. punicae]QCZ82950.1 hypothetical protein XapB_21055 [Xanthomonas citri pv. punicae]